MILSTMTEDDGFDEEFEDLDDDVLIQAATQFEVSQPSSSDFPASPRPTKRRRLNGNGDEENQDPHGEDHSNSEFNGFSSRETTLKQSKYRIHEPKVNSDLGHVILSQTQKLPDSQPWAIRGPIWKRPRPSESDIANEQRLSHRIGPSEDAMPLDELDDSDGHQVDHSLGENERSPKLRNDNEFDYEKELATLPSDMFNTPSPQGQDEEDLMVVGSENNNHTARRLVAPLNNLRQTTLFGGNGTSVPTSQTNMRFNWPAANRPEPPTHHKLDDEAMKTWVYPTNVGKIRDYQFNIVARGLFHNTLVSLPTGMGKTFIAATIMLNWYRWTKDSQIVFVAPTKPLVAQQIDACFRIAGVPRSDTTMLNGDVPPALREEEWSSKRVFFMTPQTLGNDLKKGICDPKRIVLLVVDEAHRATGAHAYVENVKFIRRFNESIRVLALTATPGGTVEAVQEVIDALDISRVEIRTEESMDIREYVHDRHVDKKTFENSEEMCLLMDFYSKTVKPLLDEIWSLNKSWPNNPLLLTPYGCTRMSREWSASDAGRRASNPLVWKVRGIFAFLGSVSHSMELLKYHGIGPFYKSLAKLREDFQTSKDKSKYRAMFFNSEHFKEMMDHLEAWTKSPDFIGHPKLSYLKEVILNHLMDSGEGRDSNIGSLSAGTRIMVFAHFRDSAEEIAQVLRRVPMIKPRVFVGQSASKNYEGMTQRVQLEVIEKFKSGVYNTLIATSIGEEGLDIGEVDLIVCYDSKSSPLRMVQRMGRTGRKRAGKIVLLQMKGKEDDDALKAKDSYERIQKEIASGDRFNFHDVRSRRILPRDAQPIPDKREVEMPWENTQPELPVPRAVGRGRRKKPPAKKFHMPDGVETGFTTASRFNGADLEEDDGAARARERKAKRRVIDAVEPVPPLEQVFLTDQETQVFERRYQYAHYGIDDEAYVSKPRLDQYPQLQRCLRPTKIIDHGRTSKLLVETMSRVSILYDHTFTGFQASFHREDLHPPDHAGFLMVDDDDERQKDEVNASASAAASRPRKRAPAKAPKARRQPDVTAMEAASSSAPPSSLALAVRSQAESLGSFDTPPPSGHGNYNDNDQDSDLDGFIVNDDEDIEEKASSGADMDDISASRSFPTTNPKASPTHGRYDDDDDNKDDDDDDNDDDDDLPDFDDLIRANGKETSLKPPKSTAGRSRRRIVDSDEDE